ncbi:bifunctional transcriptional activator/DNA repair enzyme AdaA [Psychrobacter sp. B38]|uniref:bifunctional transcriptional activator/DNA repair enzyme AdaA n=1 Tax=Psychrobacter sp. B38 TaxID=3143538 RepID=UPI00320C4B0B
MENTNQFSQKTMWKAVVSCDETYDGHFFYAVKTTGIFCRPSCKSKTPKYENVSFFPNAEIAQEAGYRACKRCRPDLHTDKNPIDCIVEKTITFLEAHSEDELSSNEIALQIGISPFHLMRIFKKSIGYTPRGYLEKIRIENAQHLLLRTELSSIDVGFEVGFQSTSSFYSAFKRITKLSHNNFRVSYKESIKRSH